MLRSLLWALLAIGSMLGALAVFMIIGEQRTPLLLPAALGGSLVGAGITTAVIVSIIAAVDRVKN